MVPDPFDRGISPGKKQIRFQRDELGGLVFRQCEVGAIPAPVDVEVDALVPAARPQLLQEGATEALAKHVSWERQTEEAEAPRRALRPPRHGPSRRTTEYTEKFPTFHAL